MKKLTLLYAVALGCLILSSCASNKETTTTTTTTTSHQQGTGLPAQTMQQRGGM